MALNLTPIRTAIEEILEGTIGTTRTVAANKFKKGAHSGREATAQKAMAIVKPRYETMFGPRLPHEATPISGKSSMRLDRLGVTVRFRYKFESEVRENARTTVIDTVMNDGDIAQQALTFHDNLKETNASVATNIVSGMLLEPEFQITDEDWENQLVIAELTATAVVNVSQATS